MNNKRIMSSSTKTKIGIFAIITFVGLLIGIIIYRRLCDASSLPNKCELINLAIDASSEMDGLRRTRPIWIDFPKQRDFSADVLNPCFTATRNFTQINSDSMFLSNTAWRNDQPLERPMLKVDTITRFNNTVTVTISIIYAPLAGTGYQIILTKIGSHYVIAKKFNTWISFTKQNFANKDVQI